MYGVRGPQATQHLHAWEWWQWEGRNATGDVGSPYIQNRSTHYAKEYVSLPLCVQ